MTWGGFHSACLKTPLNWEQGYMTPSQGPGLGIEVDWDFIKANQLTGSSKLHLSMDPEPYHV